MRCSMFLLLALLSIPLFAGFSTPVPLPIPDEDVLFGGDNAINAIDNDIYLTYIRIGESLNSADLVFAHSADAGATFSTVDVVSGFTPKSDLILPRLDVAQDVICVTYGQDVYISHDNGISFFPQSIDTHLTLSAHPRTDNGYLYLLSPNGENASSGSFSQLYETTSSMLSDNDPTYFYGYDSGMSGRIHANSAIFLKNTGGWPSFLDYVTTGDSFIYSGGTPDPYELFLCGYEENTSRLIEHGNDAGNAIDYWPESPTVDLVLVNVHNDSFTSYTADIVQTGVDTLVIYNSYPPFGPVGDSIGVNYIPRYDTLWTPSISASCAGQSMIVHVPLWIRGRVSGRQSWNCEENIYIVGNLTYTGTIPGLPPDGIMDGENQYPVNRNDYLTLASDRQIIIKYGIYDPVDSLYKHVNCDQENFIYGMLLTTSDQEAPQEDGCLTFEYQHPHRSTPNCVYNGQLYTDIDLHLCKYPPDGTHNWPWPAGSEGGFQYPEVYGAPAWPDYPHYNPLWPEYAPYMERGSLHLFGAINAYRRGYLHRSVYDALDNGYWDINQYMYGQSSNIGLPNAPDVSGAGVGYVRTINYDYRQLYNTGGINDYVISQSADDGPAYTLRKLDASGNVVSIPGMFAYGHEVTEPAFDMNGLRLGIALKNEACTVYLSQDSGVTWNEYAVGGSGANLNICVGDTTLVICGDTMKSISGNDPVPNDIQIPVESPRMVLFADNAPTTWAVADTQNGLTFLKIANNQAGWVYNLSTEANLAAFTGNQQDSLFVVLTEHEGFGSRLYFSHGNLTGHTANNDGTVAKPEVRLIIAPNPFNPTTTLSYSLPETEQVELCIYNLRGQLLRTLTRETQAGGTHNATWDGTDNHGAPVATGVYFARLQAGPRTLVQKMLLMK